LDIFVDEAAFFFLHCFAGPVADVLAGAGHKTVEYDAFADVGVADECNGVGHVI
jgi:hypothetical protein